jgi:hypothetical protein
LPAGTYQVRLTDELPAPVAGLEPGAERWVEFVRGGTVVGRELASVIGAADIGAVAKGKRPPANGALVEGLAGGEYVRVWINKDKVNYLIHLGASK